MAGMRRLSAAQVDSFDQLALARYGHHTLAHPIGRSLAIIGDAAHSTSPQLGQGANMALLDARALAHALAVEPTVEAALQAYAKMRRMHVRVFQALSFTFTPFYQSDSAVLPFIRDRLVPTIALIPPGPQFLASMVAGTRSRSVRADRLEGSCLVLDASSLRCADRIPKPDQPENASCAEP